MRRRGTRCFEASRNTLLHRRRQKLGRGVSFSIRPEDDRAWLRRGVADSAPPTRRYDEPSGKQVGLYPRGAGHSVKAYFGKAEWVMTMSEQSRSTDQARYVEQLTKIGEKSPTLAGALSRANSNRAKRIAILGSSVFAEGLEELFQ